MNSEQVVADESPCVLEWPPRQPFVHRHGAQHHRRGNHAQHAAGAGDAGHGALGVLFSHPFNCFGFVGIADAERLDCPRRQGDGTPSFL